MIPDHKYILEESGATIGSLWQSLKY